MFDKPYSYQYKGYTKESFFKIHRYTFKCRFRQTYIIRVEEYEYQVFVLKFYLKNHAKSDKKYNLLTGWNDVGRVVATNVEVMLDIYRKNELATFGFIGANTVTENQQEAREATKRFRVYRIVMRSFFSPIRFAHFEYVKESAYLLLNKAHLAERDSLKADIEVLFKKYYFI
ncbi:hypothetical protein [Hugenholtzia roseola]|uniref:hypothetical protein n=1 Tax=Hugenholtzia roseola TaxID=1002 RepID=UPI00068412D2|nr:hypothetical protein [Hugenholtzia roseola]